MERGFAKDKGLEYFKCQNCPERNYSSKKKGRFLIKQYLHNIELVCPFCRTRYIIPLKTMCYNCNSVGEIVIYTKEEFLKQKKPIKLIQNE